MRNKIKKILLIILLTTPGPAFSNPEILGKFSTVSETECNSEIHFQKNAKGVFLESCRRRDGTYKDDIHRTIISWHIKDKKIIVNINGINETFTYDDKLSCAYFGKDGNANGLVGFDLFFWRKPITCK